MQTDFQASTVPLLFRVLNPKFSNDHEFALMTIEAELDRLFNTRSRIPVEDYATLGHTIIGYGIPDFSHMSPENPVDCDRLMRLIEMAVRFHEPRVLNPVANILGRASESLIAVAVEGDIVVENRKVRLKFFPPNQQLRT